MRALIVFMVLGISGPAGAQPYRALEQARDAQAAADALAARNRDIALTNDLSALQARVQSSETLANLQAGRMVPPLPAVPLDPNAPLPVIDTSKLIQIPDAALAQSNARVRAAAANRR